MKVFYWINTIWILRITWVVFLKKRFIRCSNSFKESFSLYIN